MYAQRSKITMWCTQKSKQNPYIHRLARTERTLQPHAGFLYLTWWRLLRVCIRLVRHFKSTHPFCRECHLKVDSRVSSERVLLTVRRFPEVRPREPLHILEGAFALTEASRLSYARARVRLAGLVTMTDLRCVRAMFTKHYAAEKLLVILTSYIDDDLLLNHRSDPIYANIKKLISGQCVVKRRRDLDSPRERITWIWRENMFLKEYGPSCASTYVSWSRSSCRRRLFVKMRRACSRPFSFLFFWQTNEATRRNGEKFILK